MPQLRTPANGDLAQVVQADQGCSRAASLSRQLFQSLRSTEEAVGQSTVSALLALMDPQPDGLEHSVGELLDPLTDRSADPAAVAIAGGGKRLVGDASTEDTVPPAGGGRAGRACPARPPGC